MYRLINDSVNRPSRLTINPGKSFHTASTGRGRPALANKKPKSSRYRHPVLNIDCRKAGNSKEENRSRQ
jgi:hypothetical protein